MDKRDLVIWLIRAGQKPGGLLFSVSDVDRARRAFLVAKRDEPEVGEVEFIPVANGDGNLVIRPKRKEKENVSAEPEPVSLPFPDDLLDFSGGGDEN